jgi:perosamine synthetase
MTTGEGGTFVTSDPDLYERVLTLSNHGRRRGQIKQFWPDEVGFKYKMSNVQAAIGCAQLERLDELVARKRAILAGYRERLAGLNGLAFNPEPAGCVNGAWMPTVVFDAGLGIDREVLLQAFRAVSIDARVFFYPLSQLDMFEAVPGNRVAWDLPERAINLPSYHDMTDADQDRVAEVIHDLMVAG